MQAIADDQRRDVDYHRGGHFRDDALHFDCSQRLLQSPALVADPFGLPLSQDRNIGAQRLARIDAQKV